MSIFELIKQGGISLVPLGVCSIIVVAVIFERIVAYARVGTIPHDLLRRAENLVVSGAWYEAVRLLDTAKGAYARVAKAALVRQDAELPEITDTLTLACDAEIATATAPLPILGTIGNIAPFIGLFGTVLGIMHAFHAVAGKGSAGPAVVSAGIAEALVATAFGLGVGVVAVIANNWCNAWVERYRLALERFGTEWAYRLHHAQPARVELPESVA